MPSLNKIKRAELYKEGKTQAFLSRFLGGELRELEPVFDPKLGYRYPVAEAITDDASSTEEFLNKLYEAGILKRKLYDRIISCPKCGLSNVSIHYSCPYCMSFDIKKGSLIEHVKCGYMDVEENFRKGNKLVCPKCREELKKPDIDYRRAGIWCTCKDCGKSFDIPVPRHFCRECHINFNFEDAVIKDVYSYSLREEVKEEAASGWVFIASIKEFLEENDFNVESPALLKGKSGANHMFDIAAYKGDAKRKLTVIDVASSREEVVSEQPVIALFAKIYDVSPDYAYLIAVPKLSQNGKKMAELYNIMAIEAETEKKAIEALKEKILRE